MHFHSVPLTWETDIIEQAVAASEGVAQPTVWRISEDQLVSLTTGKGLEILAGAGMTFSLYSRRSALR